MLGSIPQRLSTPAVLFASCMSSELIPELNVVDMTTICPSGPSYHSYANGVRPPSLAAAAKKGPGSKAEAGVRRKVRGARKMTERWRR